jgi:hypothetical protein
MMKMTMTKKLLILLFSFSLPLTGYTQKRDFGIWYGVSAEHKLTDKLELDLSADIRTFKNAAKVEETFLDGGLAYNFNKYLTAAGYYRLSKNIEDDNSYYFRHKVFLDLKGTLPVRDLSLTCRLRIQTRTNTYIENEEDKHPEYTGRIKFKALYKTASIPVNPYSYVEMFCPMFSEKSGTIGKCRYSAGLEYRIAKRQSLEAEYIFQRDYLPHISDKNIISLNYNIKF